MDFAIGAGEPVVEGDTVGTRWTAYPLTEIAKLDAPAASNNDSKQAQRFTLGAGAVTPVCFNYSMISMISFSVRIFIFFLPFLFRF